MADIRVIPCLLVQDNDLVKTKQFNNPRYLGDPVNAARIFSEKEADELILLDIKASQNGQQPNYELIKEIASECFMPLAYGGGVRSLKHAHCVIRSGVEKIIVNSACYDSYDIIRQLSSTFGNQAVIASVDVKKGMWSGYSLKSHSGRRSHNLSVEAHVDKLVEAGAGEIFLTRIENEGMRTGYDLKLISMVVERTNVPVIAHGGACTIADFKSAVDVSGAAAVSAGSMFVFKGRLDAVLINYPEEFSSF